MAAKDKTEAQLERMTDEEREAWLTSEDAAEPGDDSEESDDETSDEDAGVGPQGQQDDDEQQDDSDDEGPGDRKVAVSKERNRRKKAERENVELSGKVDALTALVAQLMVQGGSTKAEAEAEAEQITETIEEQAPDIEEDPEGWAKYLEKRLMSKIESLEKENQELKTSRVVEQQTTALQQMEEAFVASHPDYYEIVNLSDESNPLTAFYIANPEVYQRHMATENPVEEAYYEGLAQHAKAAARQGKTFQPKPTVQTPAQPKVKSKSVPPSLATVNGAKERIERTEFGDLTEDEVAGLSAKERARYLRGE